MAEKSSPPPEFIEVSSKRMPEEMLPAAIKVFDMDGDGRVSKDDLKAISSDGKTISQSDLEAFINDRAAAAPNPAKIKANFAKFTSDYLLKESEGTNPSVTIDQMSQKLGAVGIMMTLQGGPRIPETLPPDILKTARQLFELNGQPAVTTADLRKLSSDGKNITYEDMSKLLDERVKNNPQLEDETKAKLSMFVNMALLKDGKGAERAVPIEVVRSRLQKYEVMIKTPDTLEGDVLQRMSAVLDVIGEPRGTAPDGKMSLRAFGTIAGTGGQITGDEMRAAIMAAAPRPKNKQQAFKAAVGLNTIIDDMIFSEKDSMNRQEFSDRLRDIGISGGIDGLPDGRSQMTPDAGADKSRKR